jgi:6-pyruvoyltetrahydropterin/6-carboxytetrahydropterin synthase
MVYLTRAEHFNAAHRLYNPAWSHERMKKYLGNVPTKTGTGTTMNYW